MIRPIKILIIVSVVNLTSTISFSQKKNSISYQSGILNHFYDEKPILMNTISLKYVRKISDFTEDVLIKSRSIKYTRVLNQKSNLSLTGGFFKGEKTKIGISHNKYAPDILWRKWYFVSLEYNRILFKKKKFELFYGGGVNYRNGTEGYLIFSSPMFIIDGQGAAFENKYSFARTESIGAVLNLNLKYHFWRNFYLSSKLDAQFYFYKFVRARNEFNELLSKHPHRDIKATKKINHTLTIGVGIDF